jgi:hypothetical protein
MRCSNIFNTSVGNHSPRVWRGIVSEPVRGQRAPKIFVTNYGGVGCGLAGLVNRCLGFAVLDIDTG